jgi:hypothetical protein
MKCLKPPKNVPHFIAKRVHLFDQSDCRNISTNEHRDYASAGGLVQSQQKSVQYS